MAIADNHIGYKHVEYCPVAIAPRTDGGLNQFVIAKYDVMKVI
ncbi:hypothetical protein HDC91_002678 [Mucilaginibacter sp. AK015]|nr:hypothetical protein [Mucilaginibacter sp. AK015]